MKRLTLLASALLAVVVFAADQAQPGPAITIVEEKVPLRKAVAQLAAQSKVPIEINLEADDDPALRLNLRGATFWKSLDEITATTGLQMQLHRSDGKIELFRRGTPGKVPVSYSAGFRIALQKLSTFRDFANSSEGCTMNLEVAWDAGFEPFYLQTRPRNLVVRDDKGKVIDAKNLGSLWSSVDRRRATSFEVTIPALPRTATRISSIKGTLPARGPSRIHEFRWKDMSLEDLSKGKVTKSAGKGATTCSVESVELGARRWTVQVAVELPPTGPDLDSFETWYVNNRVYLQSRDGKKVLLPDRPVQQLADTKRAVIDYPFSDAKGMRGSAKDWVLVCQAPAGIIEVSIPFEFKDVPLP
jgi:hypothetical protein